MTGIDTMHKTLLLIATFICLIFFVQAQEKQLARSDKELIKNMERVKDYLADMQEYIRDAQNAGNMGDIRLNLDLAIMEAENFTANVEYVINELKNIHQFAIKSELVDILSAAGKMEDKFHVLKLQGEDIVFALRDASRFSSISDIQMKISQARSKAEYSAEVFSETLSLHQNLRNTMGTDKL